MGRGGYHDHAGGGWLFCICIGSARISLCTDLYTSVANVLSLPRCRDGRLALSSSSS